MVVIKAVATFCPYLHRQGSFSSGQTSSVVARNTTGDILGDCHTFAAIAVRTQLCLTDTRRRCFVVFW